MFSDVQVMFVGRTLRLTSYTQLLRPPELRAPEGHKRTQAEVFGQWEDCQ